MINGDVSLSLSLSLSFYFGDVDDDVRFSCDPRFLTTTLSVSSLSFSLSLLPLQQPLLLLSLFFFLVKVVKKRLRTQPLPR